MFRHLVALTPLTLALGAAALLAACSSDAPTGGSSNGGASDPSGDGANYGSGSGSPTPDDGTGTTAGPTGSASTAADGGGGGGTSGGGGSMSGDGGAAVGDGGAASGGGTGAFAGAPAYIAALGPSARNAKHDFGGATPTNPAGQACLTCHNGAKGVQAFLAGGTIYKDSGGTMVTSKAEVRVRDAQGHTVSAYTDADGNFYVLPGTTLVAPWHGGARDATGTMLMTNVINDGNCNSCHTAAGQGRIVLP